MDSGALNFKKGDDRVNKISATAFGWLVVITGLHFGMNVDWNVLLNDRLPVAQRKLNVAYIPVT